MSLFKILFMALGDKFSALIHVCVLIKYNKIPVALSNFNII